MTRIYNTTKAGDMDSSLNSTFRFAGNDAYYDSFGRGAWYGHNIATVAVSRDGEVAVIAWQDGYKRGANPAAEQEIADFIGK